MSGEGRPAREWRLYVADMLTFIDKVEAYTRGLTQAEWLAEPMRYDATLRNLELIGEAATRVPDDVRALAPDVPWRLVVATRNRLIHAYLGLDDDTLWSIVEDELPALRQALRALLTR